MSSEHAISYVRDLENASIKNNNEPFLASQAEVIRQGVKRKELADLMQNLLSFNPFFRLTALECVLECPRVQNLFGETFNNTCVSICPDTTWASD